MTDKMTSWMGSHSDEVFGDSIPIQFQSALGGRSDIIPSFLPSFNFLSGCIERLRVKNEIHTDH